VTGNPEVVPKMLCEDAMKNTISLLPMVYFILAQTKREIDMVWQRGGKVAYLGPNATVLKNASTYEWLQQIYH
jgi:hypothetical protein